MEKYMMLTLSIPSSLSTVVGGLPFAPGISTCSGKILSKPV
jgi:hypothetical protein